MRTHICPFRKLATTLYANNNQPKNKQTMMTRKRSSNAQHEPLVAHSRLSIENITKDLLSRMRNQTSNLGEVSRLLLTAAILKMKQEIWYRILPLNNQSHDLSDSMGMEWEYLLPILIHIGFITAYCRSTVNSYSVCRVQWETFCFTFPGNNELKLASYQRHGEKEHMYYLCLGQPIYRSPQYQQQAILSCSFAYEELRFPDKLHKEIYAEIKKHSERLKEKRLWRRHQDYLFNRENIPPALILLNVANDARRAMPINYVCGVKAPPTGYFAEIQQEKSFALVLNLQNCPRFNRTGTQYISIHNRKQAGLNERMMVIFTAEQWGWKDAMLTGKERQRIAKAACRQVAYDYGYSHPLSTCQLPVWKGHIREEIKNGDVDEEKNNPLSPRRAGSKKYVKLIETAHPGYLRELFRYAQKVKGGKATFLELTDTINLKSSVEGEQRATLSLHHLQVRKWFMDQGGKEYSPKEKPLDTEEHKVKRIEWVRKWFDSLSDVNFLVAMLDKKWFYVTNWRRKINKVPLLDLEAPGVDNISRPQMRSRQFPVKSMFMGVVARPCPDKDFDGRIWLERVSEQDTVKRRTAHQRFCDDIIINSQHKNGDWHHNEITCGELAETIGQVYGLEDGIVDRLEFSYNTVGNTGHTKAVVFTHNQEMSGVIRFTPPNAPEVVRAITANNVIMKVRYNIGDLIERDCSCDSAYMLEAMQRVGRAIQEKLHWVPQEETCFLVIDNAGGHRTDQAIQQYTRSLYDQFNVKIIHQVPRSPYTNVLDLGVWCALQARVERTHYMRRCEVEALARSVYETWKEKESDLQDSIEKVFGRLQNVLVLIIEGHGSNDLVETKRGKRYRNLDLPTAQLLNADSDHVPQSSTIETVQQDDTVDIPGPVQFDFTMDDSDDDLEDDLFA